MPPAPFLGLGLAWPNDWRALSDPKVALPASEEDLRATNPPKGRIWIYLPHPVKMTFDRLTSSGVIAMMVWPPCLPESQGG